MLILRPHNEPIRGYVFLSHSQGIPELQHQILAKEICSREARATCPRLHDLLYSTRGLLLTRILIRSYEFFPQ